MYILGDFSTKGVKALLQIRDFLKCINFSVALSNAHLLFKIGLQLPLLNIRSIIGRRGVPQHSPADNKVLSFWYH